MYEFMERPPIIKAQLWDGSIEMAHSIAEEIKQHTGYVSMRVVSFVQPNHFVRMELELRQSSNSRYVNKGDWVVLMPVGTVEILPDQAFHHKYRPVDQQE